MNLPVRIDSSCPKTGVIAVDGAWGSSGLNLSHWPGNTTPLDLVHKLSTGCALRFAKLPERERLERAGDAAAIVNNHYDTDGVMALFATRFPALGLEHETQILAAAAAGDFFREPNTRAIALDALVTRFVDPLHSEAARSLEQASADERHTELTLQLLDELPDLLIAQELPYPELWRPVVERADLDRDELSGTAREESETLDLCSIHSSVPWRSVGPGRHTLFGSTDCDRVLAIAPHPSGGHSVRLIVSTQSWFVPACHNRLVRPDLERLADTLNQLDPHASVDDQMWRAQSQRNASPELWFGTADIASFAEHSEALRPTELPLTVIREHIYAALKQPNRQTV
ncbi:MAG: hypothetical protein ACI8TQ_001458 [Planctomycetota bacterium]|jgi:hypothetical protein